MVTSSSTDEPLRLARKQWVGGPFLPLERTLSPLNLSVESPMSEYNTFD